MVALAKAAQKPILEADGWTGIGSQLLWQADVKPAQKPLQHALNLCRTLQYKLGEMETLMFLGTLAHRQGDAALSIDFDEQALQLSRLLGDVVAEAEALGSLSVGLTMQGDLAGTQTYQEEALAIFRRLNMPESEKWLLGQLGYTAIQLGDFATAEQHLTEALTIARQKFQRAYDLWQGAGQTENAMQALAGLAYAAYQQKMPAAAAAHAGQLWQTWQESPTWAARANLKLYWQLGLVWDGLGDSRANDLWQKARALLQERSQNIPDTEARKLFLEQVPAHRAILQVSI